MSDGAFHEAAFPTLVMAGGRNLFVPIAIVPISAPMPESGERWDSEI
jgi:hypothetical protein